MRWIELEIVVPAPPAEAFPWVVEPGLLKEWMPQLEELRPRGFLHHAPIVRHGALRLALDVRVRRVVVPERLELDVTWRGAVARLHLEVEDHEDGATVTWRTGLDLPPTLRLAGPATARELRRIMRQDLERLAERLGAPHVDEGPDGDAAPADPPADPDDVRSSPGPDGELFGGAGGPSGTTISGHEAAPDGTAIRAPEDGISPADGPPEPAARGRPPRV